MLRLVLSCFLLLALCKGQLQINRIRIATSSSECTKCLTLSQCLSSRQNNCFTSNTELTFSAGEHLASSINSYYIIFNVANLSLIGESRGGLSAIIRCTTTRGFAIVSAENVNITALAFTECGTFIPPTVKRWAFRLTYLFTPDEYTPVLKAALFVVAVTDFTMQGCQVNDSNGFGFFAMNILGHSSIVGSSFYRSNRHALRMSMDMAHCSPDSHNTSDCLGGNAVFIYQDTSYCFENKQHFLEISESVFQHGVNLDYEAADWYYRANHFAPAGGLSIFSGQTSYYISVNVTSVSISSNIGYTGANLALFVHNRYGTLSGTTLSFNSCTISNGNRGFEYFSNIAYAGGVYMYYGTARSDLGNDVHECTPECGSESLCHTPSCNKTCPYIVRNVTLSKCQVFQNNGFWGAAFYVTTTLDDNVKCVNPETTLTDCHIYDNIGIDSVVRVKKVYKGVFDKEPELDLQVILTHRRLKFTIVNSTMFNNTASGQLQSNVEVPPPLTEPQKLAGAILYSDGFDISWLIDTNITDNLATALYIKDGQMNIRRTVHIEGNTGTLGGGISLINDALFQFDDEVRLFIENNTASIGGGIYIQKEYKPAFLNCFYDLSPTVVYDSEHDQETTLSKEVKVFINDNGAAVGMSIYGGYLDHCRLLTTFRLKGLDKFSDIFQIPSKSLSSIASDVRKICLCIKGEPQCLQRNVSKETFPGRTFEVEAVPVGQLDGTVPAVVLTTVKNGYEGTLAPQQDAQQIGIECAPLRYSLSSNDPLVYLELQPNAEGPLVEGSLEIGVSFMQCPLGFRLDISSGVCDCIDFLSQRGVSCDIESLSFQRPVPTWIGFRDGSILAHNRCPFDYCRTESSTITLHNTDPQCAHQRSGVLCGGCQEGLSLGFQSSRCRKCSNANAALLLIFIPAGFILVLIPIYMDFTVAKGTFNGLVFYANILQIYQNIIFPPGQVNPLTIFIAWLNLDLGIGLCFYDGMDEYGRAWLQFLFPAYIWVIAILIIIGSWYSTLVARIAGRNAVAVLATLFLLSYTKLQRIVLQVLSFTFVTSHNSKQFAVWIYDGNIAYFSAKHAVLLIVALLVLIGFIVPYTLLVLLGPILQGKFGYLMVRFRITPILDAYQGPYELRFRWWPGVMLVLRSILMLAFASNIQGNPRVNMMLILTAIVILLGIVWYTGTIYKQKLNNILEAFYIVNLALLCAWTEFNREASSNFIAAQAAISYTSVSLSLAVFIAVVVYRTYERFRKYLNCLQRLKTIAQKKEEDQELDDYVRECDLPDLRSQ